MNIKEHVQFLILMIPTLLLLVAAVITLAAPARSASELPPAGQRAADAFGAKEYVQVDTEIGPMHTVIVR